VARRRIRPRGVRPGHHEPRARAHPLNGVTRRPPPPPPRSPRIAPRAPGRPCPNARPSRRRAAADALAEVRALQRCGHVGQMAEVVVEVRVEEGLEHEPAPVGSRGAGQRDGRLAELRAGSAQSGRVGERIGRGAEAAQQVWPAAAHATSGRATPRWRGCDRPARRGRARAGAAALSARAPGRTTRRRVAGSQLEYRVVGRAAEHLGVALPHGGCQAEHVDNAVHDGVPWRRIRDHRQRRTAAGQDVLEARIDGVEGEPAAAVARVVGLRGHLSQDVVRARPPQGSVPCIRERPGSRRGCDAACSKRSMARAVRPASGARLQK
jgi:hypothetical protein